jgi:hypothetical protein
MDPRVERLIERYAYAKGDLLLARRKGRQGPTRPPSPEVIAGWALEKTRGEVLRALELVKALPLRFPAWQRQQAVQVLRGLTVTYDLTKPMIRPARALPQRRRA